MLLQLMSWPQQVPTLPSRTQLLNLQTENCSPKREKKVEKIPRLPGVHENSHRGKHPGCCSDPGLRKSMVLRGLPWPWGQSPPPKGAMATANEISVLPTEEAAVYEGASPRQAPLPTQPASGSPTQRACPSR